MRGIASHLVTTSLVAVAAFAAVPALAADVDARSTVDAVTVYPDGASVTRIITADLAPGDNTLVATDFPLTLDPSSLRVEGEAAAKPPSAPSIRGRRVPRRRSICRNSTSASKR